MPQPCLELEIGATEAALQNLRYLGIPDPDSWTYAPYSVIKPRGDGRYAGYGFPTASWTWTSLSQYELNILLGFIASGEASAEVYIKTYKDEGENRTNMLATFKCIMSRPLDRNGKNIITGSSRPTYNEVMITFTHLEEV